MRSLFRSFVSSRHRAHAAQPPWSPRGDCTVLIVGLGNPGSEHAQNRHNVGFWCLNRLARRAGADFSHGGKLAAVAEGTIAARTVALAKPRTYVNQSGAAVAELLKRFGLKPQDLVVVCDDLDREVGLLRIRGSGGHGGHNGLRSIIAAVGSDEFTRVRIGIGRPNVDGVPTRDPEHVAGYVLGDPPVAERQVLNTAVETAADAIDSLLTDGLERTMGRFNARGDTTNG
jgi:peptidyl-tRNA hydrolase, PTH1 family